MIYLRTIVLLLGSVGIAIAEDAKIGDLRISLPDGFVHRLGKGIDSQPGSLTNAEGGWEIFYDIGIGADYGGNEEIQKKHGDRIERRDIIETPLGKGLLLVLGPKKRTAFFGIEKAGYFKAIISSDQELKDFIKIVSSIRLTDEAEMHRNKAAEQDAAMKNQHKSE